jgi:hypothetical protein
MRLPDELNCPQSVADDWSQRFQYSQDIVFVCGMMKADSSGPSRDSQTRPLLAVLLRTGGFSADSFDGDPDATTKTQIGFASPIMRGAKPAKGSPQPRIGLFAARHVSAH